MSVTLGVMLLLAGSFLSETQAGYFWHMTDFHADPYYKEWHWRWNSCNRNVSETQGPLGDYECDPPYALLRSAMRAIKQHGSQPAFIMWTGDNTPHLENKTFLDIEATLEINKNCTNIVQEELGDTPCPVIVSLGNHDYFPVNQLPGETNIIYQSIYEMWKPWLNTSDMEQTFKKGAYYTTVLAGTEPPLRIIVVNTNLYYKSNKAVTGDDPADQFAWMNSTLDQARTAGEKVHLVTHIAPGTMEQSDLARWFTEQFNVRFNNLVVQYGDIIVGSYSAHQHLDTFRVFYKDDQPVIGMLVAPSLTPWRARLGENLGSAHNPAIRKILFDDNTYELTDVEQYYLDLPKANTQKDPEWEKLYSFKEMYGLNKVDAKALHDLVETEFTKTNGSKFYQYHLMNTVNTEHPSNNPCDCPCQHRHICAIQNVDYQQFDKCLEKTETKCVTSGQKTAGADSALILAYLTVTVTRFVVLKYEI